MKRRDSLNGMRFLRLSCYRRMRLLGNPAIRDLFARMLAETQRSSGLRIIAWVVMPEHMHLLVLPAHGQVSIVAPMWALKRGFALQVIARWRELDAPVLEKIVDPHGRTRFWQRGGGYDRNIWSDEELLEKTAYIHRNPVERGLVDRAVDWERSSARWYAGNTSGAVQVDCPVWLAQPAAHAR